MSPRYREEVFNVVLALLLRKRGIVAAPEQILRLHLEQGHAMPDILVHYQGLRTAIEGRIVVTPAAQNALLKKPVIEFSRELLTWVATAEVIDGPMAVIYDEAENRLHTEKAILSLTRG